MAQNSNDAVSLFYHGVAKTLFDSEVHTSLPGGRSFNFWFARDWHMWLYELNHYTVSGSAQSSLQSLVFSTPQTHTRLWWGRCRIVAAASRHLWGVEP